MLTVALTGLIFTGCEDKSNNIKETEPTVDIQSFSDSTEGHNGTIYKATNAYRLGHTGSATFYIDENGRLRHPRQCGVNISQEEAKARGWKPCKRGAKNRYLYILGKDKREKRMLEKMCKYDLKGGANG